MSVSADGGGMRPCDQMKREDQHRDGRLTGPPSRPGEKSGATQLLVSEEVFFQQRIPTLYFEGFAFDWRRC